MAYMSEDGYKKLMAELKELETVERPIRVTCRKMRNTMRLKRLRACLR